MPLQILGIGTAVPHFGIEQCEAARAAAAIGVAHGEDGDRLAKLYRVTGVTRRRSVLLEAEGNGCGNQHFFAPAADSRDRGPSLSERMERYESEAGPLALRAARQALEVSRIDPCQITHLVTVSCSGFAAPGVDIQLIKALGLPATVERTHVGFMGCHGAFNGLRVARAFTDADPSAHVLVVAVELCSLHYYYGADMQRHVANALFADGAAAVVASGAGEADGWHITHTGSCLIPDSEAAMSWSIRNHGFEMTLSPDVPVLIRTHLRPWLEGWLAARDLTLDNIGTWAVHPGGPAILKSVAQALEIPRPQMQASWEVLQEFGNMSSPTILFILESLRAANAPRPCVAIGFGPGLVAEAMLLT